MILVRLYAWVFLVSGLALFAVNLLFLLATFAGLKKADILTFGEPIGVGLGATLWWTGLSLRKLRRRRAITGLLIGFAILLVTGVFVFMITSTTEGRPVPPWSIIVLPGLGMAACAPLLVMLWVQWANLLEASDAAKLQMLSDRVGGEKKFERLLEQNPADGRIYFKRGEAYETIGENALAAADFERAMALFQEPDWKARAKEAARRVRSTT